MPLHSKQGMTERIRTFVVNDSLPNSILIHHIHLKRLDTHSVNGFDMRVAPNKSKNFEGGLERGVEKDMLEERSASAIWCDPSRDYSMKYVICQRKKVRTCSQRLL